MEPPKGSLTFELPAPPSVNQLYANAPGKGRVKTDSYKNWRNAAGWELRIARVQPLARNRWALSIRVNTTAMDIDNVIKPIADLLVWMQIVPDDRHMTELHVYRDHEIAKGRVQVTVWPINTTETKKNIP